MEKISSEAKKKYAERVREYKERIDAITARNKERQAGIERERV